MLTLFAQQAKRAGDADAAAGVGGMLLCIGIFWVMYFLVLLISLIGAWKVFTKAGQPGWAVLIPFYNTYVLVIEIAKKDMTWFLLSIFVPFAVIIPLMDAAEKFGKDRMYGLGLAFLPFIFWPMLGFGDAEYRRGRSKRYDDDDYDDRPRKRSRDDDDDDDDEDDRPRRKKRRSDDDDD